MNKKLWVLIGSLSLVTTIAFKLASNSYENFQRSLISEQVCRAAAARLQIGATREVLDFAHSALLASGHPDGDVSLSEGNTAFVSSKYSSADGKAFPCRIEGRENVDMEIHFPKSTWLDLTALAALICSTAFFMLLKIVISILLKEFQNKFINETDRRLSAVFGSTGKEKYKAPFWIEWLYQTDPKSVGEFKTKLKFLEGKIERQASDIKSQAQEKAVKEVQLIQARKFKDLTHQVRHDLRQTLSVIKSSVETLPPNLPEIGVLAGSVTSLESMIEDLKERELNSTPQEALHLEVVEVILSEVVTEQRAFLGRDSKIEISLALDDIELSPVAISSSLLKRVFTNLVRNSIEAITDSIGTIEIAVRKPNDKAVLVSITDSGGGFSEDALKNLFKKGFTTKLSGSGRGLSFCREKIREWGGTVVVESVPGKTKIEIELPIAENAPNFVLPKYIQSLQNILLVDDRPMEKELRSLCRGSLNVIKSAQEFKKYLAGKQKIENQTILFDLHLGGGKTALELLEILPPDPDYLFMTSDYLNAELLAESAKRQFLIIPKELVGPVLEDREMSARDSLGPLGIGSRSEMPDLI